MMTWIIFFAIHLHTTNLLNQAQAAEISSPETAGMTMGPVVVTPVTAPSTSAPPSTPASASASASAPAPPPSVEAKPSAEATEPMPAKPVAVVKKAKAKKAAAKPAVKPVEAAAVAAPAQAQAPASTEASKAPEVSPKEAASASTLVPPPVPVAAAPLKSRISNTEIFSKIQNLSQKNQYDAALELLQAQLKKENSKDDRLLMEFNVALLFFKKEKFEDSAKLFQEFLKNKSNMEEYAQYYLGLSYMKLNKTTEAQKEFEKILDESPNIKLRIECSNMLSEMALQAKNYKTAHNYLIKLEKRTRGSEQYAEIIYKLAQAEKGLHNHAQACKWARKLYTRHPNYAKISGWSADLATNEIDGKPSDCKANPEEFRNRIRNLMFAGLDQKAQAEINSVKEKLNKNDKFLADQLQAQFYLQEGEVSKAIEVLTPYYESMKRNFSFLMLFASANARAGEVQLAVGSYYNAYKLSPKSKLGRQALYQAAFLSYQFQDYDGAARRFQEFMKAYPTSGLNRDAKWHMAWLKYLKGDYEGAYKAFAEQKTVSRSSRHGRKVVKAAPVDRVNYWMAMSLYRQGKYDRAQPLFEALAKDNLIGYYSIAAQSRLKKMAALKVENNKLAQRSNFVAPRGLSRFMSSEFLMPSVEEETDGEENESEETLVANQYEEPAEENEEADTDGNPDQKNVDLADSLDRSSPFSNASLTRKFEQARDLVLLGLTDWARWDLYEIESKTSNREYLRALMAEYTAVGHYHRASYIAQIQFGGQRASKSLDSVRNLWEYAYPRAYASSVEKYAKSFDVPTELVWGIMRAESQYRRDAISPVGALGLMQVMPFTGHKVANLMGEKNFSAPQLLEPEVAVKVGARYLKRMMDTFQNTIPLVAAGYNAGPHRVKNWLASFGTLDTDEFIEHIPFLETRNYVKRVMSNCDVYGHLYGNQKSLFPYLSEPIPAKFSQETVAKENWDDI